VEGGGLRGRQRKKTSSGSAAPASPALGFGFGLVWFGGRGFGWRVWGGGLVASPACGFAVYGLEVLYQRILSNKRLWPT